MPECLFGCHRFKDIVCCALEIKNKLLKFVISSSSPSCLIFYTLSFKQMAEVVQEKSRGLNFGEQQLLRHGWEHGKILWSFLCKFNHCMCNVSHSGCKFLTQSALSSGKGLGRAQNGISEAIKVKVKCDKGGVSINECTAVTILVPHLSITLDFIVCKSWLACCSSPSGWPQGRGAVHLPLVGSCLQ